MMAEPTPERKKCKPREEQISEYLQDQVVKIKEVYTLAYRAFKTRTTGVESHSTLPKWWSGGTDEHYDGIKQNTNMWLDLVRELICLKISPVAYISCIFDVLSSNLTKPPIPRDLTKQRWLDRYAEAAVQETEDVLVSLEVQSELAKQHILMRKHMYN